MTETEISQIAEASKKLDKEFKEESLVLKHLKYDREKLIERCKEEGSFAEHANLLDHFSEVIDYYHAVLY